MKNKFTLRQTYNDYFVLSFLLGFLLLALYKLFNIVDNGFSASLELISIVSLIVLLIATIYLLYNAKLQLRIGRKKLSIQWLPFGFAQKKIKIGSIDKIEFIEADQIAKSSGLLVHFGDNNRIVNFGGNSAMVLTLKNNQQYTIFSEELYKQRSKILERLGLA